MAVVRAPEKTIGEVTKAAAIARWNMPEWVERRRAIRGRKIEEMLAAFPVTAQEAEQIRALLPPADGGES